MSLEVILISVISISIFLIKSLHDYLHKKKSDSIIHKKLDEVMNIVDIAQKTILTQSQNKLIDDALNIEEKLLNNEEQKKEI